LLPPAGRDTPLGGLLVPAAPMLFLFHDELEPENRPFVARPVVPVRLVDFFKLALFLLPMEELFELVDRELVFVGFLVLVAIKESPKRLIEAAGGNGPYN
jgi:hypothetical protein